MKNNVSKKILLVGDIGGGEKHYHAGDEAMSYETIRIYLQYLDKSSLTAFSRIPFNDCYGIHREPNLEWPTKAMKARNYFLILVCKCVLYRFFKIDTFKPFQLSFIKTIERNDIVHFTGGGNMNSIFSYFFYYYLFIIAVAKIFGKKVLLISQTIGPFHFIDWIFALMFINAADAVALREPPGQSHVSIGILKKNVIAMLDAAYKMPISSSYAPPQKKHKIRIGLSLHSWKKYDASFIATIFKPVFGKLSKKYDLEFILIPHLFFLDNNDTSFMKKVTKSISPQNVVSIDEYALFSSDALQKTAIKKLTGSVDILVSTRYHGVVFALSQNIPVLTLEYDPYYSRKNTSALLLVYKKNVEKYISVLQSPDVSDDIYDKLSYLIDNNQKEKDMLFRLNKKSGEKIYSVETIIESFLGKGARKQ